VISGFQPHGLNASKSQRKEKQMNYTKPELLIVSSAMKSIEGTRKGVCIIDNLDEAATVGAYEADE
jgi:hypothetical protein